MVKGNIYCNLQGFFILEDLEEEVMFDSKLRSLVDPEVRKRKGEL